MAELDFGEQLERLQFTCGMNQRYHQIRQGSWAGWDRGLKIGTGFLAVLGCIVAFADWPSGIGQGLAVVTALVAVTLNVVPLGEWSQLHGDLFRRWTDLLEESHALATTVIVDPTEAEVRRLAELQGKMHRIDGAEPRPVNRLLEKCYRRELQSRRPEPAGQS